MLFQPEKSLTCRLQKSQEKSTLEVYAPFNQYVKSSVLSHTAHSTCPNGGRVEQAPGPSFLTTPLTRTSIPSFRSTMPSLVGAGTGAATGSISALRCRDRRIVYFRQRGVNLLEHVSVGFRNIV